MLKSKLTIILGLLIFCFVSVLGQVDKSNLHQNQLMVQLMKSEDLNDFKEMVKSLDGVEYVESVTTDQLVHLLELNPYGQLSLDKVIGHLNAIPFVKHTERVVPVFSRSGRPNDRDYFEQFQMMNMEMEEVWCKGNTSTTVQGDTIVVAVVEQDDNFLFHPEIENNLWINHGEIPGDNIDNDGNNYVDDYYGINAITEAGFDLTSGNDMHGLGVLGIMGAEGDNGELLAGMAWHVKILNVINSNSSLAAVKAYDYVYNMRKLYNDTNGEKGAYIVASNSSFGRDDSFPDEFPIWCERYDLMTSVGILNVGAVTNSDVNIDEEGDIPGLCPSDGLITVSNLTIDDGAGRSGYSPENVDLAAYGTFVPSLTDSDTVFFWTGTSFSAPHVTGLIGLFYGQVCDRFIELSKSNPEESVRLMKSFILEKALPIPSQLGRSVTEGKLDPRASQTLMFDYCGIMDASLEIDRIYYNASSELVVEFNIPDPGIVEFVVHNSIGQEIYRVEEEVKLSEPWIRTIDLDNTASGVYYLSLKRGDTLVSKAFVWKRNS